MNGRAIKKPSKRPHALSNRLQKAIKSRENAIKILQSGNHGLSMRPLPTDAFASP